MDLEVRRRFGLDDSIPSEDALVPAARLLRDLTN
jgi:hypothetical protein